MENQPYPDFEMRFYNDIKLNLRIFHQAIEINLPVKYLKDQNYMKDINVDAIENNVLPIKIPMTNFESSYLISEKLLDYIYANFTSIIFPIIKHFQVCLRQCISFQNNKNIIKYPLIVKCKVIDDKKVDEEDENLITNITNNKSNSSNSIPSNNILSRNSLLNSKNFTSKILNEELEGIVSSSSLVNNLNINQSTNGKLIKIIYIYNRINILIYL